VILLRYFERKTAGEIGVALKLTEAAAQKRVSRALERLRGMLAGSGVTLSTTALATLIASQAVAAAPMGLSTSVSAAALAGGAVAGGITLTTLKLILMSKLKITAVSALVVAGVATPLVVQHHNLSRLRQENHQLLEQVQQADLLRNENERLSAQISAGREITGLSKAQLSELLRLRGEVGLLRRDSQALARLRTMEQPESSTSAATETAEAHRFVPAAAWANVGADQPEEALQTFFWAGKHGETNVVVSLLRWQIDPEIPSFGEMEQKYAEGLVGGTTRFAGSLEGFRIESLQEEGDSEVRMAIELTNKGGKAEQQTLRFIREDNQWFPVMHVWLQAKGKVRAALDVPPKFQQTQ
jgi:hypothetical protein